MALANPSAQIISVEGCPNISAFTRSILNPDNRPGLKIITSDFNSFLEERSHQKFDLIFLDGDHRKDSTISYFHQLIKLVHNDSVMIIDDIHWSKGMEEAWDYICRHPQVTVSIDTFYWGIIFFREEQAKEHFDIRL